MQTSLPSRLGGVALKVGCCEPLYCLYSKLVGACFVLWSRRSCCFLGCNKNFSERFFWGHKGAEERKKSKLNKFIHWGWLYLRVSWIFIPPHGFIDLHAKKLVGFDLQILHCLGDYSLILLLLWLVRAWTAVIMIGTLFLDFSMPGKEVTSK